MSKTIRQVCDREYRSAVRAIRPPLARESAGRSVTAPPVVVQGRGTPWVNTSNLDVSRAQIVRKGCTVEFLGGVRVKVTKVRLGRFWHDGCGGRWSYTPCASVRVVNQ